MYFPCGAHRIAARRYIFNEDVEQNEKSERAHKQANNILYTHQVHMHAAAASSESQKADAWLHALLLLLARECINNNRTLFFSWLWPRGKQSRLLCGAAAYMVITSPQQVGALDASKLKHIT